MFYGRGGKRVLPRELVRNSLGSGFLACLYLDVGTVRQRDPSHRPSADISMASYSEEDVEWFAARLREIGVSCRAYSYSTGRGNASRGVVIHAEGFAKMRRDIAPYVPPCLRYKLGVGGDLPDFDPGLWLCPGPPAALFAKVTVSPAGCRSYRNRRGEVVERPEEWVYCLDVERTHNFITKGGVVHNCQAEARVWAMYSRDPELLKVFQKRACQACARVYTKGERTCECGAETVGADVYTEVASKAFGRQIKKSDPERERLKTVFLGAIYGLGVRNMAKKLGVEEAEAKKLSDLLRQSFRQSFRWIEDQKAAVKKPPYEVRSFYGRKRRLRAYMTSGKNETIAAGERYAVNAPIQGASSDMCVLSMIRAKKRLEEAGLECWPVIFVHDSITFTCAYNDIEAAAKIIKEEMVRSPYKAVALDTELKVMPRWGNVEDMLEVGSVVDGSVAHRVEVIETERKSESAESAARAKREVQEKRKALEYGGPHMPTIGETCQQEYM